MIDINDWLYRVSVGEDSAVIAALREVSRANDRSALYDASLVYSFMCDLLPGVEFELDRTLVKSMCECGAARMLIKSLNKGYDAHSGINRAVNLFIDKTMIRDEAAVKAVLYYAYVLGIADELFSGCPKGGKNRTGGNKKGGTYRSMEELYDIIDGLEKRVSALENRVNELAAGNKDKGAGSHDDYHPDIKPYKEHPDDREFQQGKVFYDARDYRMARTMFERSAANGNSDAELFLGIMYSKGIGVSVNVSDAEHWLLSSAGKGNGNAQYRLGKLYHEAKKWSMAAYWLSASAAGGNNNAKKLLDEMKWSGLV